MLSPDATQALVDRHKAAQGRITDRTSALVTAQWRGLGSWDRADIERFVTLTRPHLSAAKRASVILAIGFYSSLFQRRAPAIAIGAIPSDFAADQPFTAVWHALKTGRPFDEAITAGESIADAQVSRFIQTASRRTGDHVAQALRIDTRWRRSPRAGACTFCQTASHQTYRSAESADFGHHRCHCTAIPTAV